MNKLFKKLFAPIAIFAMAFGVTISLNNQAEIVGASASDTTVTFVQADVGLIFEASSIGTTVNSFTKDSVNFSVFAVKTKSSAVSTTGYGYIMLMGGSIYNTSAPQGTYVSSVTVTYTSGTSTSGSTVITFGSTVLGTRVTSGGTAVVKSGSLTRTNTNGNLPYFNISNTTTNNIQISSVTVVFTTADLNQPTISLESVSGTFTKGDSGTLSPTTTNSTGATFAWSSSNSNVLSVNASTGEYQAVDFGDVTVSVIMTVNSVEYPAAKQISVNGNATISEAFSLASALTTPSVNTGFRVTIVGASTITSVATHSVYITDGTSTIQVYGGTNWRTINLPQSIVGGRVYVSGTLQNYNGNTPEITNPTVLSYTDDVEELATSILVGDITGQCETRFADYKTTVLGFTVDELTKFQTSSYSNIPAARARYLAWAAALGENPDTAGTIGSVRVVNATSNDNQILTITLISLLGFTSISAYFFYRRKKMI